jgi:hypothetical protein
MGPEHARLCLLEMIRLSKFEELELTHTCCRQHWYGHVSPKIDEDDALEIVDEEREIVEELQKQMTEIEQHVETELESLDGIWIRELENLTRTRVKCDGLSDISPRSTATEVRETRPL